MNTQRMPNARPAASFPVERFDRRQGQERARTSFVDESQLRADASGPATDRPESARTLRECVPTKDVP
jgi:hypothetical protein